LTTLPTGAVRIARDTGASIVPVFTFRTGSGHGLIIEPPFVVEKTASLEADLACGLEQVVAALERWISVAPDQWVMFQRVWPSEPVDLARVVGDDLPFASDLLEQSDDA